MPLICAYNAVIAAASWLTCEASRRLGLRQRQLSKDVQLVVSVTADIDVVTHCGRDGGAQLARRH